MSKKAQGAIGVVLLLLVFNIVWFVWLASWISEAGTMAITNGELTGVEAFFFANLNLWILIAEILGIMAYLRFGGEG